MRYCVVIVVRDFALCIRFSSLFSYYRRTDFLITFVRFFKNIYMTNRQYNDIIRGDMNEVREKNQLPMTNPFERINRF